MMFAGEEPEPLAYRVKPRPNEAFDSWMDRLTAKHEVTRAELFRHLGCDPRFAARDLARGWHGLQKEDFADFHRLIECLAWAVDTKTRSIEATFVAVPEAALLPPALRIFGCPLCWREAVEAGEPRILTRDSILCASWMCLRHHLPLSPVRRLAGDRPPGAAMRILDAQVAVMQNLRRRFPPKAAMFEFNRSLVNQWVGERTAGVRRGEMGYRARFAANRFHVSPARIALLAAAHSERGRSAERFEDFVALTPHALFKSGENRLNPKAWPRSGTIAGRRPCLT